MKYLDTTIENVDRIKKARVNINKAVIFCIFLYIIFYSVGLYIYSIEYIVSGLYFFILSIGTLILFVGLVVKREIYSLAIIMKEK